MNKSSYAQLIDLLKVCKNYIDQRTGKAYGSVDKFGTDKVIVLDSLSGLNILALDLAVGGKPVRTQPDWGVAIEQEEKLLQLFTLGMPAHFVLIGHADREVDQIHGGLKIMPAALGQKFPKYISRFFDDCIYATCEGGKFQWSTATANVDSKARNLGLKDKLEPTFVPVIANWKKKGGVITTTESAK
jgi:hypothetical protein